MTPLFYWQRRAKLTLFLALARMSSSIGIATLRSEAPQPHRNTILSALDSSHHPYACYLPAFYAKSMILGTGDIALHRKEDLKEDIRQRSPFPYNGWAKTFI
jgi:hypothetical protein